MGNGHEGKPPDERGRQWHQSNVTGSAVQPRGKPGGSTLTASLERPAPASVLKPNGAPASGTKSDKEPGAQTEARARADASWDAVFEGGPGLRREVADDARFAQLHVDGDGVIQPGAVPRVSNGFHTAESVDGILARNGLTQRPPHHQAHHVVPDEVVRRHPLMREAHRRGLFKPDAPDNIALLAERQANGIVPDKVPGLSEGLPRHQGAHPKYSKEVTDAANIVMRDLEQASGTLQGVPDDVLQGAASDVLERAWAILRGWERPHLD